LPGKPWRWIMAPKEGLLLFGGGMNVEAVAIILALLAIFVAASIGTYAVGLHKKIESVAGVLTTLGEAAQRSDEIIADEVNALKKRIAELEAEKTRSAT